MKTTFIHFSLRFDCRRLLARGLWLAILLFLLGSFGFLFGEGEGNSNPFVECYLTDEKLALDGVLNEKGWEKSPLVTPFLTLWGDAMPVAQTSVKVLWTKEALWLGIQVSEPQKEKMVARIKENDNSLIWNDDCIDISVKPKADGPVAHLIINSLNAHLDEKNGDPAWNGKWESAVTQTPEGWILEVKIPFATLEVAGSEGSEMSLNIGRNRPAFSEVSSIINTKGAFRNQHLYAKIRLAAAYRLWWQIFVPSEIMDENGTVVLNVRGQAWANYEATVTTYLGDEKVNATKAPIKANPGEDQKFPFLFKVPGTRKASVQVEFKDEKGGLVLRTEKIPLKIGDAKVYEKRRVQALFDKIDLKKLPENLRPYYAEWAKSFEELKKSPNLKKLRDLSRKLSVASSVSQIEGKEKDQEGQYYTPTTFTFQQYDAVIPLESYHKPIKITACQGEYEPGSFVLLALKDLNKVTVEVLPLKSGSKTLSPKAFEAYVIKNWWQASDSNTSERGNPTVLPEILVKDDSWSSMDDEKQRNNFTFPLELHYKEVSGPMGPVEPDMLQPVKIPIFTNRQFWFVLHVPADQEGGDYAGVVRVCEDGKEMMRVPIEVKVLPIKFEETEKVFGMYGGILCSGGKNPAWDASYENILKTCKEYGMNSLWVREGGEVSEVDGKIKVDIPEVKQAFELRKKHGLTAATPYFCGWDVKGVSGGGLFWDLPLERLKNRNEPGVKNFITLMKEVKKISQEVGIEALGYTMDECTYRKLEETCKLMDDYVHEGGLRAACAIMKHGAVEFGKNLEVPILSGEGMEIGKRASFEGIPYSWFYYHPMENFAHDRICTGLVIWYNKIQGSYPWALQDYAGSSSFDDWGGFANYRQQAYIYPSKTRAIPTIQLEGFREGVDDHRYLEMIEKRYLKLKSSAKASKYQTLLTEVSDFIENPPVAFKGDIIQVEGKVKPEDFAELRNRSQVLLVKLEEALK